MKNLYQTSAGRSVRLIVFSLSAAMLLFGIVFSGGTKVEANHPVLVEGNCDSPVPGTTQVPVSPGTPGGTSGGICGDYDGDGRIGTAEDTDGADRIFGTLNAALGPGTGAAAGTGANFNGKILIVASGRFSELLYIGNTISDRSLGTATPGNVTIEAAPGVEANIDAVLQGDPAGGNNQRQSSSGIIIAYLPEFSDRVVTLRNLSIRNYHIGVDIVRDSRVVIDNCRFENNSRSNIRIRHNTQLVVTNSRILSAGFRVGTLGTSTDPGYGIEVLDAAQARIEHTTIAHNKGAGIFTPRNNGVKLFKVSTYFNTPDILGTVTIAPDHNYAN